MGAEEVRSMWFFEEEAPSQLNLGHVNNRQCPA
jgi:hypothetical protein